jgi:hypothetical protein
MNIYIFTWNVVSYLWPKTQNRESEITLKTSFEIKEIFTWKLANKNENTMRNFKGFPNKKDYRAVSFVKMDMIQIYKVQIWIHIRRCVMNTNRLREMNILEYSSTSSFDMSLQRSGIMSLIFISQVYVLAFNTNVE